MTATGPRLWAGLKVPDQRPNTGATERYFSCWLAAAIGDRALGFLELTERQNVSLTLLDRMSNLIARPALKRLAAEASMSDDPDFQKANYALQVLRQARLSRNETAARMVEHLTYVTTNTGLRTPEIGKLSKPPGSQFASWRMLSKKKGLLGPPSGKQRSALELLI